MKKFFMVLTAGILAAGVAQAQDYFGPTNLNNTNIGESKITGPANLRNVKADSLSVMGPTQFTHLTVTGATELTGPVNSSEQGTFGQLKVTGPLDVKQITANTLSVTGPVKIKESTITGDTEVVGPLSAEKSKFGDITVTADTVTLTDADVHNIIVKNDHGQKQTLYLKKASVSGNITFESGRGLVVKSKDSDIKGDVKGATLQK